MNEQRRLLRLAGSTLALLTSATGLLNIAVLVGVGRHDLLASPDALMPVVATVVGWLIVRQVPHNAVGWLMIAVGLSSALFGASALVIMESVDVPAPLWAVAAWLSTWVFMPSYLFAFLFVPMLFPDGRPAGRLWRPVLWASGALLVVESALLAFGTTASIEPSVANPFALPAVTAVLDVVEPVIWVSMVALVLLGVGSLLHRFVRSQGQTRVQVLCVLVAVAVGVAYYLLTRSGLVLAVLLPTSIAVAVLRFRLYDAERILLRTLLYGGLAGTAACVYVGLVLAARALTGTEGGLRLQTAAIIAAVLTIHPLRDRFMALAHRLVYGRRSKPYDSLAALATQIGTAVSPDDTLPRMAEALAAALGADRVTVSIASDQGARTSYSAATGTDDRSESGRTVVSREVVHHGDTVGLVEIARGDDLTAQEAALLDVLLAQAGPALRAVALTEQLRQELQRAVVQAEELRLSRARLVTAHDTARRSIERDLHDGAQQGLLALAVELGRVQRTVPDEPEQAVVRLVELQDLARRTLVDLRALAAGTYPSVLRELGLGAALRERTESAEPQVEIHDQLTRRPSPELESAVYFACLEAITNATKHAGARRVEVILTEPAPGAVRFRVTDDGRGFDPEKTRHGTGLDGIADRLGVFDGRMEVTSAPGAGTTVIGTGYDEAERYSSTA